MDDDEKPTPKKTQENLVFPEVTSTPTETTEKPNDIDANETTEPQPEHFRSKNSYFNQIIESYLKQYPSNLGDLITADAKKAYDKYESKRLKRQIKIKYEDDEEDTTTMKPKNLDDDDELYVEIETHFDSKGMKGMKKKKLIRAIIDKIQKAIHSDLDLLNDDKKKKHRQLQIKKRNQNPLERHKVMVNKIMIPFEAIIKRHSDPISKMAPFDKITDKSGESWKKTYFGPGFLAVSKSVNSAEMGEVDVDYNKVIPANGIPQRLQKPLNIESGEEIPTANSYFDLGNRKFFIKNIDGTGLSIGFNQYTDEPPDPDAVKLFTGIENLIQTYNKNYQEEHAYEKFKPKLKSSSEELVHEISKRQANRKNSEHIVIRRSIKEMRDKDFHSNEYKVLFNKNLLPYDNYQEIYEDKNRRVSLTLNKDYDKYTPNYINKDLRNRIIQKALPSLMDDSIFYKKLKPAEILSLATLLDRKKRSVNVKKIKNVKGNVKVSRYLNTHAMNTKKIILNKKRSKRQIDKIRIYATDGIRDKGMNTDDNENIFLVEDDNVLANRAIIRELRAPEMIDNVEEKIQEEHYEVIPYVYEQPYRTNVFAGRSRKNQLMSKYPHIFLEEIGRSREDMEPVVYSKEIQDIRPKLFAENTNIRITADNKTIPIDKTTQHKVDELVNAIEPKQNYKLTVKIFPKNISDLNPGFKEIHTSINKSYNQNGLLYSSLVNVSEISKVEKLYKDSSTTEHSSMYVAKHIQEQQSKMDTLLRKHKNRLDEQLDRLKKERSHLDSLSQHVIDNLKNQMAPATTERGKADPLSSAINMSKDDVNKFLASALFHLQQQQSLRPLTTAKPTTTKPPTSTIDPAKKRLLFTIQKNENMTNQILHQINRNTQLLQTFLLKLADKLVKDKEAKREKKDDLKDLKADTTTTTNDSPINFDYNAPKFWKSFQKPFPDNFPHPEQMEMQKNGSHYSIPFIYAYQHPIQAHNYKQNIPVASVVYHGHIHANNLGKRVKKNYDIKTDNISQNDNEDKNRYFIDDLENVGKDINKPIINLSPNATSKI